MKVQPPPHMDLSDHDYKLTQDSAGYFPSLNDALDYQERVRTDPYHRDRIKAIRSLIGRIPRPKDVLDFGVGDGQVFLALELNPSLIYGVDVSDSMLELARATLGGSFVGLAGGPAKLEAVPDSSIDLVLCVNALGYLNQGDQKLFFSEAFRTLRSQGHLIVMTGNELFDLFALNSGTADFFEINFSQREARQLLVEGASERFKNAHRKNPLAFASEVAEYGFVEIAQSFASWHKLVPAIASSIYRGDLLKARNESRSYDLDLDLLPANKAWQRLFRCSIFASLSIKP